MGNTKKSKQGREKSAKVETPTPKRTTRGVAQRVVRKAPKKATQPSAPTSTLTLPPTLLSMKQLEAGWRRRSTRRSTRGDK
jgi:hypothetical protein